MRYLRHPLGLGKIALASFVSYVCSYNFGVLLGGTGVRYLSDAPDDVMEELFIELMLWGKAQGYHSFNLGMAPLAGLEDHPLTPTWNRLGAVLFRHGEEFYNFQGLRQFKDQFDPVWRPKYLASRGGMALPIVLLNIGSLISGGVLEMVKR